MIRLERILFPTDFSSFADHALAYGASFAKEYKAKLYVLHVIEDLTSVPYFEVFQVPIPADFIKDVEAMAGRQMAELADRDVLQGVEAETMIRRGVPFVEILTAAKELEIDMITIATHGRTGLQQMLFGSTAEKVVRKAPCPVLSIRHPEHEFVMPGPAAKTD